MLALQSSVENKELEELSNDEGLVKLDVDNPLVLEFADGSKIKYELDIIESPAMSHDNNIPMSNKTYTVSKTYYVGFSTLIVKLHTDVTQSGKNVTINRAYDDRSATFGKWSNTGTTVVRESGYDTTYAISEAYGQYTYTILNIGDIYTGTSRIQAHIDPAGFAYLKVL